MSLQMIRHSHSETNIKLNKLIASNAFFTHLFVDIVVMPGITSALTPEKKFEPIGIKGATGYNELKLNGFSWGLNIPTICGAAQTAFAKAKVNQKISANTFIAKRFCLTK